MTTHSTRTNIILADPTSRVLQVQFPNSGRQYTYVTIGDALPKELEPDTPLIVHARDDLAIAHFVRWLPLSTLDEHIYYKFALAVVPPEIQNLLNRLESEIDVALAQHQTRQDRELRNSARRLLGMEDV